MIPYSNYDKVAQLSLDPELFRTGFPEILAKVPAQHKIILTRLIEHLRSVRTLYFDELTFCNRVASGFPTRIDTNECA